ncbi:MAG: copper amine oxidase N-terminal domain-containing protein [Candidatus Limnocylindria bacterium]
MTSVVRRRIPLILALAAAMFATPVVAQDEPPTDAPATALRIALDRALGEHAFLLGEVIRSGIADAPDFTAAADTLDANSGDVIGAITEVYGAEAGEAFGEQWRNHVAYIVDYGRALGDGDEDAAQLAAEQLDRYVTDFSGFLADALPALPRDAVEGLIGEHVQQLEHVASFDEQDFGGAYGAIRETYAHMFAVGDGLAIGIVSLYPDRFTGREAAFSPATDLRVTLDRLLGEHSYLAALAMRAVLRDAADVPSAAEALAANSDELRDTIELIYGTAAGDAFAELWSIHVDAYVAYVTAIAADDAAAADLAIDELAEYQADFSAYVAEANPFLSGEAFEMLIATHTDHLVAQADAYATGDYAASYEVGREAYAHTGELSASLAGAIADQFPMRFPDAALPPPLPPVASVGAGLLAAGLALGVVQAVRRRPRLSATSRATGA